MVRSRYGRQADTLISPFTGREARSPSLRRFNRRHNVRPWWHILLAAFVVGLALLLTGVLYTHASPSSPPPSSTPPSLPRAPPPPSQSPPLQPESMLPPSSPASEPWQPEPWQLALIIVGAVLWAIVTIALSPTLFECLLEMLRCWCYL